MVEFGLGRLRKISEIHPRMKKPYLIISALVIGLASCQKDANMKTASAVKEEIYGKMPDGREVKIFTLTNKNGL